MCRKGARHEHIKQSYTLLLYHASVVYVVSGWRGKVWEGGGENRPALVF